MIAKAVRIGRRPVLLARACLSIAAISVALRFVPLDRLLGWAGHARDGSARRGAASPSRPDVETPAWAVRTASRILPGTSCLAHALALARLLCADGSEVSLQIGVRNRPSFAAHAWIEHGGRPLLDSGGHVASFTSLVRWDLPYPRVSR